ncbi:hypothetical protein GJ496_008217 [Pomphorhynchus laevis]|nr:hypothetical protein GJ496_008217 [Pomphorhynchus laevis]
MSLNTKSIDIKGNIYLTDLPFCRRHNNNGWYVILFQPEKWRTLLDESSNGKTQDWFVKKWLHLFRTHTERMISKISAAKIMCTSFLSDLITENDLQDGIYQCNIAIAIPAIIFYTLSEIYHLSKSS